MKVKVFNEFEQISAFRGIEVKRQLWEDQVYLELKTQFFFSEDIQKQRRLRKTLLIAIKENSTKSYQSQEQVLVQFSKFLIEAFSKSLYR